MEDKKINVILGRYIVLFLFWQFLSGSWEWHNIFMGLIVSYLVTTLSLKLFGTLGLEMVYRPKKLFKFIEFSFKFIIEVIKSNISMAKLVLSPELPVSPGFIKYKTNLKTNLAKVILANTITLTPGTLTVEVDGDELLVHMIDKDNLEGLLDNHLEELLIKIEED